MPDAIIWINGRLTAGSDGWRLVSVPPHPRMAAKIAAATARAAAAAGAPSTTGRDWLRAVGRSAPALTAQALSIAGAAGEADACWTRRRSRAQRSPVPSTPSPPRPARSTWS